MATNKTPKAPLALRAKPTKRAPLMQDKYIMYVYVCLQRGKLQLTDEELSHLFGPNNSVVPHMDPVWFTRFLDRSRTMYQVHANRYLRPSSSLLSNKSLSLYKAQTGPHTYTFADERRRIMRIENFSDSRGDRELSSQDLVPFESDTIVFENAVLVKRFQRVLLSLVLCYESTRFPDDPSACVYWEHCFTVKEKDIRGLEMDSDFVYTSDGASLYEMVRSWKSAVCLVFDSSCRTDTILTLCSLAMGDPDLGVEFKLKCNLPENARVLDMRNVRPVRNGGDEPLKTYEGHHGLEGGESTRCIQRGLVCLSEMVKLPAGFSIVTENESVVVLRHVLRDALIVVPKDATVLNTGRVADCHDSIVPAGCLTEWFACGYSSFVVNRGVSGVPPLVIYAAGSTPDKISTCTNGKTPKVATLRVFPAEEYYRVVPKQDMFRGYMFDHAVCLLPGSMAIVTPNRLEVPSCIAVMYSVLVFRGLIDQAGSTDNPAPISLVFARTADLVEANVIMYTYMSLSDSFVLPSASAFEVAVDSHASLMKLRKTLSANPRPVAPTPKICVSDTEGPMSAEMEGVLLDIQEALYYPDKTKKEADGTGPPRVDEVLSLVSQKPRVGPCAVPLGHCVLFGHGAEDGECFTRVTIGVRTLGLLNMKILRACGLFNKKHGSTRAVLLIPKTKGVVPTPRWLGKTTLLSDDTCVIDHSKGCGALPAPSLEQTCFFQLNYSPSTPTDRDIRTTMDGVEVQMSRIEQAVCSAKARGYEEQRLVRLFKSAHAKHERCLFDVETEPSGSAGCQLETRSWLVAAKTQRGWRRETTSIGDGEFFPSIEVASDSTGDMLEEEELLSSPLAEYKLNLSRKSLPGRHAMARADRSAGECGCAYEACLDEAVLLGHGVRVTETKGAKRNFDVSACLTCFYRAVHPCVPDMKVGDMMLDYEFAVHGRGRLQPVYALLSHLAQSCRVNCFPSYRLITLSRHRAASVWTRGTDEISTRMSRTNTIGAFLCAQDPRLSPLLARCCNPTPLAPKEFYHGSILLPRGDEEELLLEAYSRTLGPAFVFEPVAAFPSRVVTSLGDWRFLRLMTKYEDFKRFPGITVVDRHTVAFASESPLFYLAGEGPLVQRLESVAVIVDSGSRYRTDVLKNEKPDWPDPDAVRDPIKCRPKHTVLDEMFMRTGKRDPLETCAVDRRSWSALVQAQWMFSKRCSLSVASDWETEYPVSESLCGIGPRNPGSFLLRWLCGAPPDRFTRGAPERSLCGYKEFGRVELNCEIARSKDPLVWRGFDILCSRVLTCPSEKLWSTGLCKVTNRGLDTFAETSRAPAAHLIVIVPSNEWHARPLDSPDAQYDEDESSRVWFSETQVCSATEFICVLASVMLSGCVHEELEIRCSRKGVYAYIQRALAWFARAAGPFRSRNVTVFTPEAEIDAPSWTHALPAGVDVLKSSKKNYIVSCTAQCAKKPDVNVMLDKSEAIEKVNSFGNIMLHADRSSVLLAREQRESGIHVTAETLYREHEHKANDYHCSDSVYIYNERSLKRFCEFRDVPRGIRGPELWTRPMPWSKANPAAFCLKVSELKYRWESGIEEPKQVAVRGEGVEFFPYETPLRKWTRCASDGMLVPKKARFWYSVDHGRSLRRSIEGSSDNESESCESEDVSSEEQEDTIAQRPADARDPAHSRASYSDTVTLGCEWYDDATSSALMLNSYLTIEFVWSTPALEGHVFFEPVYNADYTRTTELKDDGKLIKFYKPHKYRSLARDLYTVLMYGCGLTPVFEMARAPSDAAGDNVFNLALCAMAVSHHITQMAYLPSRKVTVVVPDGREQALGIVRAISRGIVVTTPRINREGVRSYSFEKLPETLETEFGSSAVARRSTLSRQPVCCPCPTDFLGRGNGMSLYLKSVKHWPSLSRRDDVKHPTSSLDPRWIGLTLCLAEWEGEREMADRLTPGAIECAIRTLELPR